jgi:hypothetical protein
MNDFVQRSFKIQDFEKWVKEVPTIDKALDSLSLQINELISGGDTRFY